MSFFRVMQVVEGVSTRIGRVFTDLEQAVRFAAKQPLRLQCRVVEQEIGNEVWPVMRGWTSSMPAPDPDFATAQLAVRPRELSPFPSYTPRPIQTESKVIYREAAAPEGGYISNPQMVAMGRRLRP